MEKHRSPMRLRFDDARASFGRRLDSFAMGPKLRGQLQFARRMDAVASLTNSVTGMGGHNDKSRQTRPNPQRLAECLTYRELEVLFRTNGHASSYIDRLVSGCTAEGWEVTTSDEEAAPIQPIEEGLRVGQQVSDAFRSGLQYGASLIFIVTDDPDKYSEPLDLDKVEKVIALQVFDEIEFQPWTYEGDPLSPQYKRPKLWSITPDNYDTGFMTSPGHFLVHHSRVLYFPGRILSDRQRRTRNGKDDPIIEAIRNELEDLTAVYGAAAVSAQQMNRDILTMDLASAEGGPSWEAVKLRAKLLAMGNSIINMTLLGREEKLEGRSMNIAGYKELLDGAKAAWSAVTRIPQIKLFGDSPSGLRGGKDQSAEQQMQDVVSDFQRTHMRSNLIHLYVIVYASKQGPTGGKVPETVGIEFAPITKLNRIEQAQEKLVTAQTDVALVQGLILDPTELRKHRYSSEYTTTAPMVDPDFDVIDPLEDPLVLPAPDDPSDPSVQPEAGDPTAPGAEVGSGLNGAQFDKAIVLIGRVEAGETNKLTAVAMMTAAFPLMPIEKINAIFDPITPRALVLPEDEPAPEDI